MKVIDDLSEKHSFRNAVVTSGTFDGVHVGHRKILKHVIDLANSSGGESVVITYWPHPRFVLGNGWGSLKLLTTFAEKADVLAESGIDFLVKLPFTRKFSEMSSKSFIEDILINKIGTKKLVIGYDHRFGKNREGSFDYIKENQRQFGFDVDEIPRHDIDNVTVSSTKIRQALAEGQIEESSKLLGRDFSINGIVVKGDQLGRTMGFPTANISVQEEFKLIPRDGVYAVTVTINGETFKGMLNIGKRPTLNGAKHQIEVNIFNFSKDIYGLNVGIQFKKFLRAEAKFEGLDALKKQLYNDKEVALAVLNQ